MVVRVVILFDKENGGKGYLLDHSKLIRMDMVSEMVCGGEQFEQALICADAAY